MLASQENHLGWIQNITKAENPKHQLWRLLLGLLPDWSVEATCFPSCHSHFDGPNQTVDVILPLVNVGSVAKSHLGSHPTKNIIHQHTKANTFSAGYILPWNLPPRLHFHGDRFARQVSWARSEKEEAKRRGKLIGQLEEGLLFWEVSHQCCPTHSIPRIVFTKLGYSYSLWKFLELHATMSEQSGFPAVLT